MTGGGGKGGFLQSVFSGGGDAQSVRGSWFVR